MLTDPADSQRQCRRHVTSVYGGIQVAGPTEHCVIPADGIVVARPNKIAPDVEAVSRGST